MRLAELEGKRVVILGAGREGVSAARLLCSRLGLDRISLVAEQEPDTETLEQLSWHHGLALRFDPRIFEMLSDYDIAIRSPGLSWYRRDLMMARERGLLMTSLTDLYLAEHEDSLVIGVTGTKGKSTTASLIRTALGACGMRAIAAGNIGTPIFDADPDGHADAIVLEVSSYQACDLQHGPRMAVLTSLYPEHLDWHGGLENYYRDKLNLLQRTRGAVFVNGADREAVQRTDALASRNLFGSVGGFHTVGQLLMRGTEKIGSLAEIPLPGEHNASNVCAALSVVHSLGLDSGQAFRSLSSYEGLPHRHHTVATAHGIEFIDDSLSTIPQATIQALRALGDRPVSLILGGRDRGVDMGSLARELDAPRIQRIALMGETGSLLSILLAPGTLAKAQLVDTMPAAVDFCVAGLAEGGVVLLSPAAATGPEFRDAMSRGDAFADAARALG